MLRPMPLPSESLGALERTPSVVRPILRSKAGCRGASYAPAVMEERWSPSRNGWDSLTQQVCGETSENNICTMSSASSIVLTPPMVTLRPVREDDPE